MKKCKTADEYISHHSERKESLVKLRKILLDANLNETIKWGAPVYTHQGSNIVGLGAFKSYTAMWFFQGALLKDPYGKLINAQEGKTKSLRQWRFNSPEEIQEKLIMQYVEEAIRNQEAGREIKPSRNKPLIIPDELKNLLTKDPQLRSRFDELSLSCRREYSEYINEAKREETRMRRMEKIVPMIREKKGLNDKYK